MTTLTDLMLILVSSKLYVYYVPGKLLVSSKGLFVLGPSDHFRKRTHKTDTYDSHTHTYGDKPFHEKTSNDKFQGLFGVSC